MSSHEFTPPLSIEDRSENVGPEGHVNSVTLLLRDALGKLFALHVATDANHAASIQEFAEDDGDIPEPVFVVPDTVDDQVVLDIINGVQPSLLGKYLVSQES